MLKVFQERFYLCPLSVIVRANIETFLNTQNTKSFCDRSEHLSNEVYFCNTILSEVNF